MKKTWVNQCGGVLLGLCLGEIAWANPQGPSIVNGQVNFANPNAQTLNITNTPGAIINWQSFSIDLNETTRFIQQSAASAILNRVAGQNPSDIMGQLLSNGRVFLLNPNGIVFGPDAVVDTAGLIASSLNMTDQDFIKGNLHFEGSPQSGAITNQGYIKAGANGEIFLIAPNIENSGIIETDGGRLILAAGEKLTIASLDSGDIVFEVQAPAHAVVNLGELITNGGAAAIFAGTIEHSGAINADSVFVDTQGRVVLAASDDIHLHQGSIISASGSNELDAGTVTITAHNSQSDNNGMVYVLGEIRAAGKTGGDVVIESDALLMTGRIDVNGADRGGKVTLHSSKRALVTRSAKVSADASTGHGGTIQQYAEEGLFSSGTYSATGQTGGRVELLGTDVKLAAAEVDVNGQHQGGAIRIGGGFKGDEAGVINATNTQVNGTTLLNADAVAAGDGGTVVVWSDGQTRFSGTISASGGAHSGNGGTAEVSGKLGLAYNGLVDLSASQGDAGTLLLDPKTITLTNGPASGLGLTVLLDPDPNAADLFGGDDGVLLGSGMLAIAERLDDFVANNAGAVYLFNPNTGALLATLTGSQTDDNVGNSITALTNGNYLVGSGVWDNGGIVNAGAATWGDGTTGINGAVSAVNSLVGTTAGDLIGISVTALTNGNYVTFSRFWDNGAMTNAGAATWGNGATGTAGTVSAANSLVGSTTDDEIGARLVALSNGNYVVGSHKWNDGAVARVGAATWGNGLGGTVGAVSAVNSLVGTTTFDQVSSGGITALSNGNYVVGSIAWNNGGLLGAGAATWGNGLGGTVGTVTIANSLVGTSGNDQIGFAVALTNGNYVVVSSQWNNGALSNAGAVTWGDGTVGITGAVSAANSLVGTTPNNLVGLRGVTVLSNGNYVVVSPAWDNGALSNVGAVTWGDGTTGIIGAVSAANSLVGSTANDFVGQTSLSGNPVIALSNGNYAVPSPDWDNGAIVDAGAVTWGNGLGGTVGAVSAANSLVGTTMGDQVGSGGASGLGVIALTNGNFVVSSPDWQSGGLGLGAATWGNGLGGTVGSVSAANSLVTTNGQIAEDVTALTNGNYVVRSPSWGTVSVVQVGAVTFGDGAIGTVGTVTAANSLVGSTAFDQVGGSITALSDGNYVVTSDLWNGVVTQGGAVTLGDGTTGTSGAVSASNSVVGSTANDQIGSDGIIDVSGGKFAIFSSNADTVNGVDAGQIIVVDPSGGGGIGNSLFSDTPGSDVSITNGSIEATLNTGTALVLQANNDITQNAGADIAVIAGGSGGDLTLQAGRSIFFNADISTDGGNFTAIANSTLADGVVDAERDPGTAVINFSANATITTTGGDVVIRLKDGAGLTNNAGGDITIGPDGAGVDAGTGSITIENQNAGQGLIMQMAIGGGVLANDNSTIDITVDTLELQGAAATHINSAVSGNGGDITIAPFTPGTTIGLAGGSGTLNLTANEWNAINLTGTTSGTLTIGNAIAGDIQISGYTAPGNRTMSFITGGSFNVLIGLNSAGTLDLTINVDANSDSSESLSIANVTADTLLMIGGTDGTDTLIADNIVNSWFITGADSGTLNTDAFTDFANLNGGTNADTFAITDVGSLSGQVDGFAGSNTLDYSSQLSSPGLVVNLAAGTASQLGSFTNITNFIGGASSDQLIGPNVANTWNITANDAGNVAGFTFTSYNLLQGAIGTGSGARDNARCQPIILFTAQAKPPSER